MKGDFTRDTFDPARHFSRVLMQQGRVQLDADWNEQAAILLHYLQTLATDLIGPFGGPNGANFGFKISLDNAGGDKAANAKRPADAANAKAARPTKSARLTNAKAAKANRNADAERGDFVIGSGRYYVAGMLCENDSNCTFFDQPDYPLPSDREAYLSKLLPDAGDYMAYLDVWERHLTFLDNELIREVALGGPDTATRAKLVWQVKLASLRDFKSMIEEASQADTQGKMRAQLKPVSVLPDPCITPPDSQYRGPENQLYRVEIHDFAWNAGDKDPQWTFKWSRDNGSVVAAWLGTSEDGGLLVNSTRGFEAGGWVEISSANDELHGLSGKLVKVVKVEADALYLDEGPDTKWDEKNLVKFRRWDQRESGDTSLYMGAVVGSTNTPIDLEDGIQVIFEYADNQKYGNHSFRTGDYWLIPARVITGEIEWPYELDANGDPTEERQALPARGIRHHYAPLSILSWADGGYSAGPSDERHPFNPLT